VGREGRPARQCQDGRRRRQGFERARADHARGALRIDDAEAIGADAEQLLDALEKLIADKFGESE
jgi:hypothetical protein